MTPFSAAAILTAAGLALAACGPALPKGVDADRLEAAVSGAIGDPNTCVLIGRPGSGQIVWRYNTHLTCGRGLPVCDKPGGRTVGDLLKTVAADGRPRATSCGIPGDVSRGVGWAAGPVPGRQLVYAAVMEGPRALPGRIMSEEIEGAFKDAGL